MKIQILTNEQLLAVANYDPGGCLCGHFESCNVCSRSSATREFERHAACAALEVLKHRGVRLEEVKPISIYDSTTYKIRTEGIHCKKCGYLDGYHRDGCPG